ncbi:hypothetical protein GCM10009747_18660 [Agromyces humatus]|uniref:Uncharacterized protein n=1 Tax=Agromyces humatus TaxID=279573 RepID=A0ABN2KM65_9MICO
MPEERYANATEAMKAGVQLGGIPQPPSTWRENEDALNAALESLRGRLTEESINAARTDVSRRRHF